MSLKPHTPSPFLEKLKKAFIYLLLTSGSTWGLLAPSIASAGFFSFSSLLQGIIPQASAASEVQNSQTLALLAPATNLDPSPDTGSDVNVAGNSALVPQDGPSGTAADIDERPASYAITVYTVRDGDTLSGIAEMFNVPVGAITGANELQGKPIHPGQELIILPIATSQYTVKTGDTIESIAKATHSDAFDLKQYNDLASDADLIAGSTILIPNAEAQTLAQSPSQGPQKNPAAPAKKTTSKAVVKTKAPAAKHVSSFEPYLGGSGPSLPGYFAWPTSSGAPITQGLHGWNAVDIGAHSGSGIYAAAAGTVIIARQGGYNGGYGSYVVVRHSNGTQTLYGHMSKVLAQVGESVVQGQTIGLVGTTGNSTGPHLHFEVRGAKNPFAN